MIVHSIHVQNFRCIYDETLPCDKLTVLIGPNGAGKSTFLRALDIFYQPSLKYTEDDFYNKDTTKDIIINVSFTDLSLDENELFNKYVEDGKLTVEKVMKWPPSKDNQKYHGTRLQNSDFDEFRSATGGDLRREYNKLKNGKYSELLDYSNKEEVEKILQEWENSHPDQCLQRRDQGQFFGFKAVGESHLERYTKFIFVPAVRDASEEASEGKGNILTEIMDLVVRSVLSQRKEIRELQEETQKQYNKVIDPGRLEELQKLEKELSDTMKTYVPDASVLLNWNVNDEITIPMPKADVRLVEDEYPSSVERTGHGLQRAFLLTMFQHLAIAQSLPEDDKDENDDTTDETSTRKFSIKIPNLIIGIEEPELYQHPNRQRHLANILQKLATGRITGVSDCTQIIYATHSPLFVDIKECNTIRSISKVKTDPDMPKHTKVSYTNLDDVAKIIEKADGKSEGTYSSKTLEPRLKAIMTSMVNEGFFANIAVLVEGENDKAAIVGMAKALGHNLESKGISIISCNGKRSMDRPIAIFKKFGIDVYAIWDSDFEEDGANPEDNHRLLRLFGEQIDDWPEKITDQLACFKKNLNHTLSTEIGVELFDECMDTCCEKICMKKKYAKKNPHVLEEIIQEAKKKGKSSKTLETIISKIVTLKEY